jgi:hypothetical protein
MEFTNIYYLTAYWVELSWRLFVMSILDYR